MEPLVFSYVRFSSPQQAKGASFARQTEATERWAEKQQPPLKLADQKFYDEGVSGWDGSNVSTGRLGDFLQFIRAGKVAKGSTLVIENLDRLSRSPDIFAALDIIKQIVGAGIRLVTLSDGMEYTAEKLVEQPYVIFTIVGTFLRGQQESNLKSERVRDALQRKRKNLSVRKWDTSIPSWLTLSKDKASFTVDEGKANVVRRIFTDYDNGKSTSTIAKELTDEGVERPYGKKMPVHKRNRWHTSTIVDYLESRSVTGEYQPRQRVKGDKNKKVDVGQLQENYYPPIIDRELYLRVAAKMSVRKKVRGRRSEHIVNIFRGMLRCPYCGGTLMLNRQALYKNKVKYGMTESFICDHSHHFGRNCLRYGWSRVEFEQCFMEFASDIHKEYLKFNRTKITDSQNKIDALKVELLDIERKRKRLLPLFENEVIDQVELKQRASELNEDKKRITASLLETTSIQTPEQTKFDLEKFIDVDLDDSEKREQLADVVSRLFSSIDVYFVGLPSRYKMLKTAQHRYLEQGRLKPNQIFNRLNKLLPFQRERFFVGHMKDGSLMQWPVAQFRDLDLVDLYGRNAEQEFKNLGLLPK